MNVKQLIEKLEKVTDKQKEAYYENIGNNISTVLENTIVLLNPIHKFCSDVPKSDVVKDPIIVPGGIFPVTPTSKDSDVQNGNAQNIPGTMIKDSGDGVPLRNPKEKL